MKWLSKKNVGYALLGVGAAALLGVQVLAKVSSELVLSSTIALAVVGVGAYLVWK